MLAAARIRRLRRSGDAGALRELLRSDSEALRRHAAHALGELRDRHALEPLIALARDRGEDNEFVAEAAVSALGRLADPRVLPVLEESLDRPEPTVRLAAVDALARLRDERALAPLRRASRDEDRLVAEEAVEAVGHVPGPEAVAFLVEVLEDPERNKLHWSAVQGLGTQGAVDELFAAYTNPNAGHRVREWSEEELTRLARLGVGGRGEGPVHTGRPRLPDWISGGGD